MSNEARMLLVTRAGTTYAVDERSLRAVVPIPRVTRVPSAPTAVVGLIGWRGTVLALLEPSRQHHSPELPSAALVLQCDNELLAVAVDAVDGWDSAPTVPTLSAERVRDNARTEIEVMHPLEARTPDEH